MAANKPTIASFYYNCLGALNLFLMVCMRTAIYLTEVWGWARDGSQGCPLVIMNNLLRIKRLFWKAVRKFWVVGVERRLILGVFNRMMLIKYWGFYLDELFYLGIKKKHVRDETLGSIWTTFRTQVLKRKILVELVDGQNLLSHFEMVAF